MLSDAVGRHQAIAKRVKALDQWISEFVQKHGTPGDMLAIVWPLLKHANVSTPAGSGSAERAAAMPAAEAAMPNEDGFVVRLSRRFVVKTVFPWVARRANMLYLAARPHNLL